MADIFDFEPRRDQYAVMGNPVRHSRSPRIHTLFAEQTAQNMDYTAIQVDLGGFPQAVGNFAAAGGKGLNVTVPFKQEAFALAETRAERAQRAGAVNTLVLGGGPIHGDNTDGVGLVTDLGRNLGLELAARRILVMGAGGAARGVLAPLLAEGPTQLVIVNRTPDRAVELAAAFADLGPVLGCGYPDLNGQHFDLIINATSASLQGDLPPLPDGLLAPGAAAYDMMYGAEPTPFMTWASAHGAAQVDDGLGMLVEQAAESFFIWRGVRPDTPVVIAQLRAEMAQERDA